MTRKQILENAVDHLLCQHRAAGQVRQSSAWTNIETQVAFADFLFHQNNLPELARDLQDETVERMAEAVAHDLELAFESGAAFNLRKLGLSSVDWKQVAARLLEWAGVEAAGKGASHD